MRKTIVAAGALFMAVGVGQAEAKGCIKGAIVGGIAGHYAGHGIAGAVAGCVAGRALANRADRRNATVSPPPSRAPAPRAGAGGYVGY